MKRRLTLDFGFFQPVVVGNLVFEDNDGDGMQTAVDTPLAGVVLHLTNADGSDVVDVAGQPVVDLTTGAEGTYSFGNLAPGTYRVSVLSAPGGFVAAKTGAGTSATDSSTGAATSTVLVSGASDSTLDFGFFRPVSIGDRVWLDTTLNSVQDPGEPGVPGVVITVRDASGILVATQATDANGNWLVGNLPPGTYSVTFTRPSGMVFVSQNAGAAAADSNAAISTGIADPVTVLSGQSDLTIDAGLVRTGSIEGYVYVDGDGTKTKTAADAPIPNVTVTVVGTTVFGNFVRFLVTTDGDGHYLVGDLPPGTYTIQQTQPGGYLSAAENPGTLGGVASRDSLASISVGAGEKSMANNFGEIRSASLPTTGSDAVAPVELALALFAVGSGCWGSPDAAA